jgi:hypothetical protein
MWVCKGYNRLKFYNRKLNAWASYRHTNEVKASVPLCFWDRRDLLSAMKSLHRKGNRGEQEAALVKLVDDFERAYGTNA